MKRPKQQIEPTNKYCLCSQSRIYLIPLTSLLSKKYSKYVNSLTLAGNTMKKATLVDSLKIIEEYQTYH